MTNISALRINQTRLYLVATLCIVTDNGVIVNPWKGERDCNKFSWAHVVGHASELRARKAVTGIINYDAIR